MAKSSWRFLFVDVNESVTITEQDTKWITYLAGRFPKGNLKADFIAPDNEAMIKAMYGYPSADWPDVYELIELNKQFGVYVSANPGTSSDVPNYYGGYYQTSLGYMKMYCNTSKDDPNFLVSVKPNKINSILQMENSNATVTLSTLNEKGSSASIVITRIPAKLIKNTSEIAFDYWNQKKPFRYAIDRAKGIITPSSESVKDSDAQSIVCGTITLADDGTYTVVLGKPASTTVEGWNTAADETKYGIPFIDLTKYGSGVYDYSAYYKDDFEKWNSLSDTGSGEDAVLADHNKILTAILNGGTAEDIGDAKVDLSYSEGLVEKIRFLFNCESITKSWAVQKSPTAQETAFKFTDVVYDKYIYDETLPFAIGSDIEKAFTAKEVVSYTATTDTSVDSSKTYYTKGTDGTYTEVAEPNTDDIASYYEVTKTAGTLSTSDLKEILERGYADYKVLLLDGTAANQRVYQYKEADEDEGVAEGWYDITSEYATKRIIAVGNVGNVLVNGKALSGTALTKEVAKYNHNIYLAVDDGSNAYLDQMTEDGEGDLALTVNPSWNMFTFEVTEEDEEGEIHTSGTFTGSLDEMALNENGSECFFEEIFPADSATYAELHAYDTFEDDLDDKGYYTGYRFGDAELTATGQRYMDSIVAENIANGNTGGNCSDATVAIQKQFARAMKASMDEACAPKYDDARVFVECSGIDSVKETFTAVRKAHMMSMIVSPKLIDANTFAKMSSMTVSGRCRGSVQYCQELQFKDKNTRKKYYATPVGAMAAMIMTIKRDALGALQADWINKGGMGGQIDDFFIGRTPKKARWDFTDDDTKVMDTKGVCPILMDVDDGVMAVSSCTTELNAGDWVDIGNCSAFDECKREIRDKVMKPQIEKKINPFWISQRESDAQDILDQWATGASDAPWALGEADCTKCNNDYTKAQKIFNIKVRVRVHPFSKWVKLTFTNLSQITTVSEE